MTWKQQISLSLISHQLKISPWPQLRKEESMCNTVFNKVSMDKMKTERVDGGDSCFLYHFSQLAEMCANFSSSTLQIHLGCSLFLFFSVFPTFSSLFFVARRAFESFISVQVVIPVLVYLGMTIQRESQSHITFLYCLQLQDIFPSFSVLENTL